MLPLSAWRVRDVGTPRREEPEKPWGCLDLSIADSECLEDEITEQKLLPSRLRGSFGADFEDGLTAR